ncbi:MAG: hypothetical protein U0270_30240 [Labilithrix sp.]
MLLRRVAVFVGPLLAGCSLVTSLDDLSGGPLTADGGPTSSVAGEGGVDAAADAPASSTSDAADAGPLTFCAAHPTTTASVCEDFDREGSTWATEVAGEGSVVTLSSAVARSTPRSLSGEITGKGSVRAAYWRNGPIGSELVHHARLSYSLYVDRAPTAGAIEINMWRFRAGDTASDLYAHLSPDGFALYEQFVMATADTRLLLAPIEVPLQRWIEVSIEVDFDAKQVTFIVDGNARNAPLTVIRAGIPELLAGLTFAGASTTAAKIFVDDYLHERL